MATFAKSSFNALSYATFRPTYPPKIFQTVLAYHRSSPSPSSPSTTPAKPSTLLDLGCGHGTIARELSSSFGRVVGCDPSAKMISQAISSTPGCNTSSSSSTAPTSSSQEKEKWTNIEFKQASAEDLSFLPPKSVDMVVAGQAAHWFKYDLVWPELARVVRPGGTLAFWGYKDNVFVGHSAATKILEKYCYGGRDGEGRELMGRFWEQPGRDILRGLMRSVKPPEAEWEEGRRVEYEPEPSPDAGEGGGKGEVLVKRRLKLGEVEGYVRTFSAYWNWIAEFPGRRCRAEGGEGDVVDWMFDEMRRGEKEWEDAGEGWRDVEVECEWGSVIILARRR